MAIEIDNQRFRKLLQAYPAKAIEILYEQYAQSLKKLALKLTQDELATEDIVQEAFIVIWQNHKHLAQQNDQSIEPYFVRIVRNKSITFFRKKRMNTVTHFLPLKGEQMRNAEKSMELQIIEKELSLQLREVVATLPLRERECLLMRFDEEMSIPEIADRLKVTPKAIERSLTSARKRLKKYWG
ncbi:MAG TPA: sigma-70 family RNA polymerase sigma factor [Chryseolinea sp.]|nr:sigma-70 family RNA polymerase sigma factor [Chryseolinea sp.]HPM31493.1 sigma-70 family RNA polymerase sigma factor [Chryseolinea sp.]